jgi:hypothetical protein
MMVNPGGVNPAQTPERTSEQSVAEAYRTGRGSLRQPGSGGKVEGQDTGRTPVSRPSAATTQRVGYQEGGRRLQLRGLRAGR